MPKDIPLIQIHPTDNVAVAVRSIARGEQVPVAGRTITVHDPIPAGHKVAVSKIEAGSSVRKYGYPIGTASAAIEEGRHVHSSNLVTGLGAAETYAYIENNVPGRTSSAGDGTPLFDGYRRSDGRVGTRNEVWLLTTVGCMNRSVERMARMAASRFPNRSDGIHAFTHPFGCSQLGDDLGNTRRLLAGLIRNPNAGGVLIVGLGCENNQMTSLLEELGPMDTERLKTVVAQEVDDEIEAGMSAISDLLDAMAEDRREPCPVASLVLGVKCGGSDGFSGISANPAVGRLVDIHCAYGGTALLSEVPEMFGAERILMQRAVSEPVHDAVVSLIRDFKEYFLRHGETIHENPSPGNIEGGLTTLEEKSLGAIQKGGIAPVTGVLTYGATLESKSAQGGLVLVEAPGNDAVSSTALAAAGASIILFTTGRGTPLGVPVPTIKISSNSALAGQKPHWIDFDCGLSLSGEADLDRLAEDLYRKVQSVASGEKVQNEVNDYREIAIWKEGVTL